MSTVSIGKKYDPKAIHRKVRVDQILEDGIVQWKTKSFTQPGNDDRYHPAIDFVTGEATCTCPDHVYRKAKNHPTVHTPDLACKHVQSVIANLRRKAL